MPVHFTTPFDLAMYGKTYFGNERTTFVIGTDGVIAKVLRKVKPADHDGLVLEALKETVPPLA
jgi:thioredoxin-dependent peroxiredoxin